MTIQTPPRPRSPLDLRRDLGTRLRILRVNASLSGKDLAERIGCHPSKVSRVELGTTHPSPDDVRAWCMHTGADQGETDDLVADAIAVEAAYSTWRSSQRQGLLRMQEEVNDLFARTRKFQTYEPRLLPGLLQTKAYASAVLHIARKRLDSPDDVDVAAAARHSLRKVFSGPATFAYLIEEHVLRSPLAGPEVMTEQAAQLIEDSHRPSVSIGIIPAGLRPRHAVENFAMYDQEQVRIQLLSGRFTVTAPSDVAEYVAVFEELSTMAVYGDKARAIIRDAMG